MKPLPGDTPDILDRRRYHLILVDTTRSEESDYIVARFKQKASSPIEAFEIVRKHRLAPFANTPGLELRVTDDD